MKLSFWRRARASISAWTDMRQQRDVLAWRVLELEALVTDLKELH